MSYQPPNPREITERGTAIYERNYRAEYERKWHGRFAAIDISSELAFVADYPEEALAIAKAAVPHGIFFLVRIGSQAAFKSSRFAAYASRRGI
jgi:hypothetical protein